MESYKSHCPDCGATYTWEGFKTGIGKTEAQLQQMERDRTTCRECGGTNLQTDLDMDPNCAGAQASSFAANLILGMLGGSNPK